MKLTVFCTQSAAVGVQSAVFCAQSAAVTPALAAADLSGAAMLRNAAEPMGRAAAAPAVARLAPTARAWRIRFAPAASVIGSGLRIRLR